MWSRVFYFVSSSWEVFSLVECFPQRESRARLASLEVLGGAVLFSGVSALLVAQVAFFVAVVVVA